MCIQIVNERKAQKIIIHAEHTHIYNQYTQHTCMRSNWATKHNEKPNKWLKQNNLLSFLAVARASS